MCCCCDWFCGEIVLNYAKAFVASVLSPSTICFHASICRTLPFQLRFKHPFRYWGKWEEAHSFLMPPCACRWIKQHNCIHILTHSFAAWHLVDQGSGPQPAQLFFSHTSAVIDVPTLKNECVSHVKCTNTAVNVSEEIRVISGDR